MAWKIVTVILGATLAGILWTAYRFAIDLEEGFHG